MGKEVLYFQTYKTPENIATNNTLLLLKRIYHYRPSLFFQFLNCCFEENDLKCENLGVLFENQPSSSERTVPDGLISQKSFQIIIETKRRTGGFSIEQLEGHLSSFKGMSDIEILLALGDDKVGDELKEEIKQRIKNNDKRAIFLTLSFLDVVKILRDSGIVKEHEYEIKELVDEFYDFCKESGLIKETRMIARTAGGTLKEDLELGVYYDVYGQMRDVEFFGLYSNKSVVAIGKMLKIVSVKDGKIEKVVKHYDNKKVLTDEQEERINKAVEQLNLGNNYVYLVDQFYETNFYKETKYSIQSMKYFYLDDMLDGILSKHEKYKNKKVKDLSAKELAEILKDKKWSDFEP